MPSHYAPMNIFGDDGMKVHLPVDLINVAHAQEISNTQEVFVYRGSGASIIIDILQKVDVEDLEAAAKFHLDAIAEDNEATEHHSILVQRPTTNELFPIVLDGRQVLKKAGSIHHLRTLFALFRIKAKNHDVVVSFNIPIETGKGPGRNGAVTAEQEQLITADFFKAVESLTIVNYNLFAPP